MCAAFFRGIAMKAFAIVLMLVSAAAAKDAPLYKVEDCGRYMAQMDLNTCAANNEQSADDALNALYKQVMASKMERADKDRLRDSERTWIKSRDKDCDEQAEPDKGGSIYNMDLANCLEDRTAARIRDLKKMVSAP
jgi:uncharacterized protein YecT (DUF1311 family)